MKSFKLWKGKYAPLKYERDPFDTYLDWNLYTETWGCGDPKKATCNVPKKGGDKCVLIIYGCDNFKGKCAATNIGSKNSHDMKRLGFLKTESKKGGAIYIGDSVSSIRLRGKNCFV